MKTKIVKITKKNKAKTLKRAVSILKMGGLVVFPTETVYGLGANALEPKAVKKIFKAKGRPSDNPIIVHIGNKKELPKLVKNISEEQKKLIKAFWPGPLTLIFEKSEKVPSIVSGGLSTIAVRMPSDLTARGLLKVADFPIAAPSANISGKPSGTSGEDILRDLSGKVEMIISTNNSKIGLESTVVKMNIKGTPLILRPGAVTKEMIQDVLGRKTLFTKNKKDLHASPGTKYRHYAPKARLRLLSEEEMKKVASKFSKNTKLGIITTKEKEKSFKKYSPNVFVLGEKKDLHKISRNLYRALRFFDDKKVDLILCPSFPEKGIGVALMDRLKRAAM